MGEGKWLGVNEDGKEGRVYRGSSKVKRGENIIFFLGKKR